MALLIAAIGINMSAIDMDDLHKAHKVHHIYVNRLLDGCQESVEWTTGMECWDKIFVLACNLKCYMDQVNS